MRRLYKTLLVGLASLSILGSVSGQNSYNVRLALFSIDTSSRIACYDLEVSNTGDSSWILANYNFGIFYDASALSFRSDSLLVDDVIYDQAITRFETSISGSPLAYEDSLGFIRLSLAANEAGNVIDNTGDWLPTIRLCFDILFDDITSPATCAPFNFGNTTLSNLLGVPPDILQSWFSDTERQDLRLNQAFDIIPDQTRTSCYVLEENTEGLCNDGIDNDEDGLMDCQDLTGCASGILPIRLTTPTCFDTLGGIEITNNNQSLAFSIDGGITFSPDSSFRGLAPGVYDIVVTRNGVRSCAFTTPVIIPSPDCQEFDDISCSDGIDNDGDGLIDCNDPGCAPLIDQLVIDAPRVCPLLDDGSIMILSLYDSVLYSIDEGQNFSLDGDFMNLSEDEYNLIVLNGITGCESVPDNSPVLLRAAEPCAVPAEICADGLDNDGDGLIDCADQDCQNDPACDQFAAVYFPNVVMKESTRNNFFGVTTSADASVTIIDMSIYDRWGALIYHIENRSAADRSHRWNAFLKNQVVQTGVYTYAAVLSFEGRERTYAGEFLLL